MAFLLVGMDAVLEHCKKVSLAWLGPCKLVVASVSAEVQLDTKASIGWLAPGILGSTVGQL